MTKPDEALLWARERAAKWQDEGGGEAGPAYRRGGLDFLLGEEVEGYLAGAAASADRIKELEARVAELEAALRPSMWVGPTGVDVSFSGRPNATSLPGTVGGSGGDGRSTSTPVGDSGRADTEVKEADQ